MMDTPFAPEKATLLLNIKQPNVMVSTIWYADYNREVKLYSYDFIHMWDGMWDETIWYADYKKKFR